MKLHLNHTSEKRHDGANPLVATERRRPRKAICVDRRVQVGLLTRWNATGKGNVNGDANGGKAVVVRDRDIASEDNIGAHFNRASLI